MSQQKTVIENIERTRSYMLESKDLPDSAKDNMGSLLDAAKIAANGTDDKIGSIADLVCSLVVYEVRRTIRSPIEIQKAIAEHEARCRKTFNPHGRVAILLQLSKSWPFGIFLSVAILSPHFPSVIEIIRTLVMKL